MITVEVTAAINSSGTTQIFYIADEGFSSLPTDTPANQAFDTSLDSFRVSTAAFGNGKTTGASPKTLGQIDIVNIDGAYDSWSNYSFDGRSVIIRRGRGAYPAGFVTIFTGVIDNITVDFDSVTIFLRDKQAVFNKPVLPNTYAGNNSLPNGLEGVSDLKGKKKPRIFGSVFNIDPVLVNTSKLTYQISDSAINSIGVVRDKGVALTAGADYTTSAGLQAATVGSGSYATCLAEGYFRLGSTPAGKVTCDAVQGAASADRSAPAIVKALALASGLTTGEIDATAFSAAHTANPAIVGIRVEDDDTYSKVMDDLSTSIGMFYVFTPAGVLTAGILLIPSGSSVFDFAEYDIGKGITRKPAKDNNVPTFQVAVKYLKNYAPYSNDLAGSIGASLSSSLSQGFQIEQATDLTVLTQFMTADRLEIETLLTTSSDAATEAARLLAIYKVKRDIFEVPIAFSALPSSALYITALTSLTLNRFGLSAGRLFRIIGIDYVRKTRQAIITLWG